MRHASSSLTFALGFLTVVEHPEQGLFGGYLVLTRTGKPLEFHCTAPIRPNRAQQILYGPSLQPFLYGEQIGATLVRHAKATPVAVLTDCAPALTVREHIETPVALVLSASRESGAATGFDEVTTRAFRFDGAHSEGGAPKPHVAGDRTLPFQLGAQQLAVSHDFEDDRDRILQQMNGLSETFDLDEPFGRIREAISEARKGAR